MIESIGTAMEEGVKAIPDIITASAGSPLGIFALMIICLSGLAFFFFRGAKQHVRLIIYLFLFGGAVAFVISLKNEATNQSTVGGGVLRGGNPLPTSSEPDTVPSRTGQSAPQSRSWLSPAKVSQITGIRLPGRSVGDQYLPQSEGIEAFKLFAAQRGMTVKQTEFFAWADLDGTEAHQTRDGLLRELQQAGYVYQPLPMGQSSGQESEMFILQGRERYIVGSWTVSPYGREEDISNVRYAVVWGWALLQ
jgi:hypothetical protein